MSKSQEQPTFPGMALSLPPKLSTEARKAVNEFLDRSAVFESQLAACHERYETLHQQASDLQLGLIAESGREIQAELQRLHDELVDLRWRRRELLPTLVEEHGRAVVAAKRELEATIERELARFAQVGVTAAAMPAGDTTAGRIQLQNRVDQELPVIKARADVRDAEAALHGAEAGAVALMGWRSFALRWPSVSTPYAESVNKIGGLHDLDGPPTWPEQMGYADTADEIGLATHLPPRHQQTLQQLVDLVGAFNTARRVARGLETPKLRNQVAGLLDKVPDNPNLFRIYERDAHEPPQAVPKPPRTRIIDKPRSNVGDVLNVL